MGRRRVPVIALTGHLGAGKTTVLNYLMLKPGARIGVIVNDFGSINVDAGLVTGQVDEAASIAGGCVCCLPDAGGLDDALEKLTHPRLRLDAVIVEASGVAEPLTVARLIRHSDVEHVRLGGVVEVVDASAYFTTVDTSVLPPARFAAATLVLINKTDLLPAHDRDDIIARISARIRERNPAVHMLVTDRGQIDPTLVFDTAQEQDPVDQLPLAALIRKDHPEATHQHADAVTVSAYEPIDPVRLGNLLENPPAGVYRLKGSVLINTTGTRRSYVVNLVGPHIHIASASQAVGQGLVAIGAHLNDDEVRRHLEEALRPAQTPATAAELRRLDTYRGLRSGPGGVRSKEPAPS